MRTLLILLACPLFLLADDWPHYLGPTRNNHWRETGLIEKFPDGGPKVVWRAKIEGGYSGPAVAGGRVYVGDFVSGADPKAEVYERTNQNGTERLLCFDQKTGKQIWSTNHGCRYSISFPNGPRTTPCVDGDYVYFLGAEGYLTCVDANRGMGLWSKDFKKDFGAKTPLWGFAGHPFVDGDKVFCITGGDGACVVALDKKTGDVRWKKLTAAEPGYSSPSIIEVEGRRQLIVWHAESVNALDPKTGEKLWSVPLKASTGSAIMVPVTHGNLMFVGGFSHVCKGIKLTKSGGEGTWTGDRKTGLYPVNSQPIVEDGLMYGVCQNGELRCVEMATGKRHWETLDHLNGKGGQCATAFLIKNGNRYFLFNDRGEIIIARLSAKGYEEISRAKVIEPTGHTGGRDVVFCAPACADKCMFIRNDKELICVSLAQ